MVKAREELCFCFKHPGKTQAIYLCINLTKSSEVVSKVMVTLADYSNIVTRTVWNFIVCSLLLPWKEKTLRLSPCLVLPRSGPLSPFLTVTVMCEKVSCPRASVHPRPPRYKSALVIAGSYHTRWSHVPATNKPTPPCCWVPSETPVATALNLSALTGTVSLSLSVALFSACWTCRCCRTGEVKQMWLH